MGRTYYDENFGYWEGMDEEENREFYRDVSARSVRKKCQGCGRMVKILPDYVYCNSCADKIERGQEF